MRPTSQAFPDACNAGATAGDVAVLLNNDVDILEHLVAPLGEDPTLGTAAALSMRPDGERIDLSG
ncbi:MAG TPA: hypothetical protein VHZ31_05850 [Solirubrobacteraceae bacterium]|nr:hypothetical protein [Solirubrobacteraceae bacterium]